MNEKRLTMQQYSIFRSIGVLCAAILSGATKDRSVYDIYNFGFDLS